MMQLHDTRSQASLSLEEALLHPSSPSKGLYTLKKWPKLDFSQFLSLDYKGLAKALCMHLGVRLNGLEKALNRCSIQAPLKQLKGFSFPLFVQELYHGPTLAFKDMALQPLGVLLSEGAKKAQQKLVVLVATSGDTGPATLESLAQLENVFVVCLYPSKGTSLIQALQMQTAQAPNLKVYGIEGDFDKAQSLLKTLLNSPDFKHGLEKLGFSVGVANSINFGRVLFQIVYHVWGYLELVRLGTINYAGPIKIVVPSGNFGNALGAFYAKEMGLPVCKIAVVSNANNVLEDFIKTGVYDIRQRSLQKTYAPAMDILKSSNVERLLYHLFGFKRTQECMQALDIHQFYSLTAHELSLLQKHFESYSCTDETCLENIANIYNSHGYLIDPHTATAFNALKENTPHILVSTASWSKFPSTIYLALEGKNCSDQKALELLEQKEIKPPVSVQTLLKKTPHHLEVLQIPEIASHIEAWLKSL